MLQGPHFTKNGHGMGESPKRVLITGCGGMLGNAIYPYFEQRCHAVFATDKQVSGPWIQELDVRDADAQFVLQGLAGGRGSKQDQQDDRTKHQIDNS